MKHLEITNRQKGQALIALIVFTLIATTIIASTVLISVATNTASGKAVEGSVALDIAESGAENALLRMLRDTSYTGETLYITSGTAVITITGTNPKTMTSVGTSGAHKRTIQVVASDSAGVMTVTSWKEL